MVELAPAKRGMRCRLSIAATSHDFRADFNRVNVLFGENAAQPTCRDRHAKGLSTVPSAAGGSSSSTSGRSLCFRGAATLPSIAFFSESAA
jgi:hypothetical protein